MHTTKPLPQYLVQRFQGWKATTYTENESWYRRLADDGQHPRAMLITCCDSRVHATSIFGAEQGEFFLHRNIANLVPPYKPDGAQHGTSAAIEYAVTVLKVAHIIIMGHSNCGGVAGCLDMCAGRAPELDQKESFVGRWMDILRPGYERIKDLPNKTRPLPSKKKRCSSLCKISRPSHSSPTTLKAVRFQFTASGTISAKARLKSFCSRKANSAKSDFKIRASSSHLTKKLKKTLP